MDIVDININVYKYTLDNTKRHVNDSNNISHWIKSNNINARNTPIFNKYIKFLNQKDMTTLVKCIKYNINIVPVLYQLNYNDINLLITESLKYGNIYMMTLINNCIKIDKKLLIKQIQSACNNGHCNVIKCLHKKFKLTKQDFKIRNNIACKMACEYDHFNIVKYLHRKIGLSKQDFKSNDCNSVCILACEYDYINIVKYLHTKFGFTKEDFQLFGSYTCRIACVKSNYNVIRYLHKQIGLSREDFQTNNNEACKRACENGQLSIVKYLHQEIGLTKQDFQSSRNKACRKACKYYYDDIVKYIYLEVYQ